MWLKPERLRAISGVTLISFVLFNIGSVFAAPNMFLLLRAFNGASSGIILWMLYAMVARTRFPARVMGLYIGCQSGVALVLAFICSRYVIPTFGGRGGFAALSLVGTALIFCVPFIPSRFGPLIGGRGERKWPGLRGFAALTATFTYAAAIMALWVYVDPLARTDGLDSRVIGYAISAGLAMQILGGWVASFFGHRFNPLAAIIIGGFVNLFVLGSLLVSAPPAIFIAAIAIFGFLWAFILSFVTPFVMIADPTGRAVLLIGTAELLGAAAGPALVSIAIHFIGIQSAPLASATLFGVGGMICASLYARPMFLDRVGQG